MESYRRQVRVISDNVFFYTVAVQVKLGFVWVDIWRENCDADDADEIEYLKNCAEEVAEKLADTV